MNWSLFFSTFMLIFLAEMGDKTQLAVMSQSAASSYKWTIFAAGALALVATTGIGVLAGDIVRRFIPNEMWIKLAGGLLFMVFGGIMLWEGLSPKRASAASAVPAPVAQVRSAWRDSNVISRICELEGASVSKCSQIFRESRDEELKSVVKSILCEDQWHHESFLCLLASKAEDDFPFTDNIIKRLPEPKEFFKIDVANPVETLTAHKRLMGTLYKVLAENVEMEKLRDTLTSLSVSEENHASRLSQLKK